MWALRRMMDAGAVAGLVGLVAVPAVAESAPEPAQMMAPEDGGLRRWAAAEPFDLFAEPSGSAARVAPAAPGAVFDNLGCREVAGAFWCRLQARDGGAKGFARARSLVPVQGPDGIIAVGPDDSKSRARRRDFDATGAVACAQEVGESLGQCRASVARSGGGDATVVVTFANGFARQLYFGHGAFVSASATMSGAGRDTEWTLDGDLYVIRVDDQQYRISRDFILGE